MQSLSGLTVLNPTKGVPTAGSGGPTPPAGAGQPIGLLLALTKAA